MYFQGKNRKSVYQKKFWTYFKTVSQQGPCPTRPCPMRPYCSQKPPTNSVTEPKNIYNWETYQVTFLANHNKSTQRSDFSKQMPTLVAVFYVFSSVHCPWPYQLILHGKLKIFRTLRKFSILCMAWFTQRAEKEPCWKRTVS